MHRTTTLTATLLLAAAPLITTAGDPVAGEQKMEACIACHGEQGVGDVDMYPILAGQHESYLYHSMRAYQTGERDNAIMVQQMRGLSEQDLRDLAAFYAAQDHADGVYTTRIGRGASID